MKKRATAMLMCIVMLFVMGCGSSSSDASGDSSSAEDASADADEEALLEEVDMPEYDALDYVVLGDYLGLEVECTQYSASDEEYEEYVNNLLDTCSSYFPESESTQVQDGDYVNIDFVGTLDGEEFDGGSDEEYQLEIGSGTFIDDFEEQLIGSSVGDTVEVEVTFPDTYSTEELAGQDAVFTVTINYIYEAGYTDAFVDNYTSGTYETTEAYDEYIWDYLEEQAVSYTEEALEDAVQSAVLDCCEITSYPDGLTEYYVYMYYAQDAYYAEYYGTDFATYISLYGYSDTDEYLEALETQVTENLIPLYLVQEAIIADQGLEATDEGIDGFLDDYASYYGYDDVDSLLEAYSCTTTADFISLVGEDSFNSAVVNYMVWDMLCESAVVTYVEDGSTDSDS